MSCINTLPSDIRNEKPKLACPFIPIFLSVVVTGFETANKYVVRNILGQKIYFAAERKYTTLLSRIRLVKIINVGVCSFS